MTNGSVTHKSMLAFKVLKRLFKLFLFVYCFDFCRCIKHLQKHAKPKGAELADDEFILHMEGTASTQRVVRHIGGTSWPGLFKSSTLMITNLYFFFPRIK